jgi:uncharacterized damage-inducible protein DinB
VEIEDFLEYSEFCRKRVSGVFENLSSEIFIKEHDGWGGYNSIQILTTHIVAVEDSWLQEDIFGKEWNDYNPKGFNTPMSLLEKWEEVRQGTKDYIASLNQEELKREIEVKWRKKHTFTVEKILIQIFTHEIHHLAQVNTLLRINNIEPPKLDYIRM